MKILKERRILKLTIQGRINGCARSLKTQDKAHVDTNLEFREKVLFLDVIGKEVRVNANA